MHIASGIVNRRFRESYRWLAFLSKSVDSFDKKIPRSLLFAKTDSDCQGFKCLKA
jgi:hypothetical protein